MKKIIMLCILALSLVFAFPNFGQCEQLEYMGNFENENYLALTTQVGNVGQKKFVLDVTSVSVDKEQRGSLQFTKFSGIIYSRRGVSDLDSVPLLIEIWVCQEEDGSDQAQFFLIKNFEKNPSATSPVPKSAIAFTVRNNLATNTLYNMMIAVYNNKNY